jgi:hypothetical protein
MENQKAFNEQIKAIYRLLMVLFSLFVLAGGALVYYANNPSAFNFSSNSDTVAAVPEEVDEDLIVDGIHVRTGLIDDEGLMVVVNNCTNCHSAKIVTQNRMNEER